MKEKKTLFAVCFGCVSKVKYETDDEPSAAVKITKRGINHKGRAKGESALWNEFPQNLKPVAAARSEEFSSTRAVETSTGASSPGGPFERAGRSSSGSASEIEEAPELTQPPKKSPDFEAVVEEKTVHDVSAAAVREAYKEGRTNKSDITSDATPEMRSEEGRKGHPSRDGGLSCHPVLSLAWSVASSISSADEDGDSHASDYE